MKKKYKTSKNGKIVAIVASAIMIACVLLKWIDLSNLMDYYDEAKILPNEDVKAQEIIEEHHNKFSLLDISKVLGDIDFNEDDEEAMGVVQSAASTIVYVIIIMGALNILAVSLGWTKFSKVTTVFSIIVSVLLVGGFIALAYYLNSSLSKEFGVDEIFKLTLSPYLVIAGSIASCVGVRLKDKTEPAEDMTANGGIPVNGVENMNVGRICPNCGAEIPVGSDFCPSCGGKIEG